MVEYFYLKPKFNFEGEYHFSLLSVNVSIVMVTLAPVNHV